MTKSLSVSLKVFAALMAYLVLVKLILTFFPAVFSSPAQAAVFQWPLLAIWTATGSLGVWLADKTGFAPAWGGSVSNKARLLLPALWGIGLGVLAIATDAVTGWTRLAAVAMKIPSINIAWPTSAIIYPGGAVIVEVIYRLLIIPLLLWLISSVLLKGRKQEQVFWVLAVLTSLIEPVSQNITPILHWSTRWHFVPVLFEDYALNFSQAYFFRRYGFFSAIWERVVFYLFWHVLWGLMGH